MILDQFKSALPLDDVLVIDCHGHLGNWQHVHMPKNTVEHIIETMDYLGVDRLCLSHFLGCLIDCPGGNDLLAEAVGQYPDRFIGQITINPNCPDEILPELDRCRNRHGMRLAKLHPVFHDQPVDGKGYEAFWRYAEEMDMIVLVHTWESDSNCGPELFGRVAREHPRAKIILAHAGVTQKGCQQAISTAKKHDNLYLDTASSQPHLGMIERFVREVGADRVLFGSDIPLLEPAAQLGRIAYARIKESVKEKILGLNMQGLLGK